MKRGILPLVAMTGMFMSVASAQEAPVRAEIVARLPQSVGNIAITPDNELIFSHHPFHGGKAENKTPYLIYRFKPLAAGYVSR